MTPQPLPSAAEIRNLKARITELEGEIEERLEQLAEGPDEAEAALGRFVRALYVEKMGKEPHPLTRLDSWVKRNLKGRCK